MNQMVKTGIIAAGVIALGVVGFLVFKFVKSEDTQGVTYGDTRARYKSGTSYGQGKPQGAPGAGSFQQMRDQRMRAQRMGQGGGGQ